jgi:hypothetical protein
MLLSRTAEVLSEGVRYTDGMQDAANNFAINVGPAHVLKAHKFSPACRPHCVPQDTTTRLVVGM